MPVESTMNQMLEAVAHKCSSGDTNSSTQEKLPIYTVSDKALSGTV